MVIIHDTHDNVDTILIDQKKKKLIKTLGKLGLVMSLPLVIDNDCFVTL